MTAPKLTEAQREWLTTLGRGNDFFPISRAERLDCEARGYVAWKEHSGFWLTDDGRAALRGDR